VFLGLRPDLDPLDCRLAEERAIKAPAPGTVKVTAALPVLRDRAEIDKELRDGKRESVLLELEGKPVRLTNLNKVYFPEPGYTKRDLLAYYWGVADMILPFLRDRPLVLHRYPNGVSGDAFYQKEAGDDAPEWMDTFGIHSGERKKDIRYLVVNDVAGLLYVANLRLYRAAPLVEPHRRSRTARLCVLRP
jgi:bifunctional non-homologous end joining protein LigD